MDYNTARQRIFTAFLGANPQCVACESEGRVAAASVAHHMVSIESGGTNDWYNLQALCKKCHALLQEQEGG